jgi:hypothetical protein
MAWWLISGMQMDEAMGVVNYTDICREALEDDDKSTEGGKSG